MWSCRMGIRSSFPSTILLDLEVVPLAGPDVLFQEPHLLRPEEPGDLRRAEVEPEIVERVLRLQFVRDVEPLSPFQLLHRGKIPVPAVRPDDPEHVGEFVVVRCDHPPLDRRHVVGDEKGERGGQAEIPRLSGGQLRPEGLAIVLEQHDPRFGAKRTDRVEVPGEPEGVREEQRLDLRGPDPLRERAGGHVQRGRFAVDRNGCHPHLQDRHDVRRPGEGGEPHLLPLSRASPGCEAPASAPGSRSRRC